MAFGSNQNSGVSKKAYAFKIRQKRDGKEIPPFFEVKERDEETKKWTIQSNDGSVTFLKGDLVNIESKENEWNGEVIKSVSATFETEDEIYFLTINSSFLGRNLINGIVNLPSYKDVGISLYMSKPKEEGGKSWPSVALRQGADEDLIMGKYRYDELPKPEETKYKGTILKDYTAAEDLLRKEVDSISEAVSEFGKNRRNSEGSATTASESSEQRSSSVEDNIDEDVPF